MSYNDEFENLIRNFKLDDMDDAPAPPQTRREPQAARPRAAEPLRQGARAQAEPPRRPAEPRQERREPPRRPAPPPHDGGARKGNFQVRIDDSKFYTQAGMPPRPPRDNQPPPPDDDEEPQDGRLGGLGRWTKALLVLAIALGLSAFLSYFALMSASDLFGINKEDRDLIFTLPDNLGISQVASLLKEKGVITQPLTFQLYCALKSKGDDFISGTYDLNSNMSYDQIINKFSTVVNEVVEVQITFYEGMTMREIADKLEKSKVCTAEDFYAFLDQEKLPWGFDFLGGIPDSAQRYRRFEGYLFPDTYTFTEGEDVSTVVQKFLVNFNNKFDDADLREKIKNSGLTVDQVVTLASIIQKEVSSDADMKMVSSVFHNRLASDQISKLQSDVTVFYVENDLKPFLGSEQGKITPGDPNQPVYDAYNTYACDGLPVGPICNPGMNAINAALEPTESNYLFFVADKEGKTYYAATQAEHDANVANVLQMGDAHGVGTGIGPKEEAGEEQ